MDFFQLQHTILMRVSDITIVCILQFFLDVHFITKTGIIPFELAGCFQC